MSKYALRLPKSLFEQARKTAKKDEISMNQLFVTAIAEKIAILEAEDLISKRAKSADIGAFSRVLDKVPNAEPVAGDDIID